MTTRDKITKIIYQNSTDTSDSLCIKFGKAESVIDQIEALILPAVSRSNKEEEDPIIGSITEIGFTTPSNHGFLKIEIPYSYYKIEKWKKGDKVELVITR